MKLTLMSYNIERGFHTLDHILDKDRLHAAQRAVKRVQPDVLALTEACYGGKNSQGIRMNYQAIFNFPHGQFGGYPTFGSWRGDEGGNCLLSRLPMQARAVQLAYKGAVHAQIPLDEKVLTIDVVHPSYSVSDEEKLKTLSPLLSTRTHPYVITGDFNTVHPDEEYDWETITNALMDFNPDKAHATIEIWKRAQLVKHFFGIGLIDAFPESARESTVPSWYVYQERREGVRMDFAFVSPDIDVIDAYVLKNEDTDVASDHYPIVTVLNV